MTGSTLQAINVFSPSQSTGGTIAGRIQNNFIGNQAVALSGATEAGGISAVIQGQTDATLLIDGNTIRQTNDDFRAIGVAFRGPANPLAGTLGANTVVSDVTITNNDVLPGNGPTAFPLASILVEADNQTGAFNKSPTVRADIRNNTAPTTPVFDFADAHIIFFEYDGDGTSGNSNNDGIGQLVDTDAPSANAAAQLASTNTGTTFANPEVQLIAGPINTPPATPTPLLAAPGGVEAAPNELMETAPTRSEPLPPPLGASEPDPAPPAADAGGTPAPAEPLPSEPPPSGTPTRSEPLPPPLGAGEPEPAPAPAGTVTLALTQAALDALVAAAVARWQASGLSDAQSAALDALAVTVADLSGLYLGSAAPCEIRIDSDAAGYGWFVDATPADDVEFGNGTGTRLTADPSALPAGRIDLLTTLMHEMGHVLGIGDSYAAGDRDALMFGYLFTGERRLPGAADADGATPGSILSEEFAVAPIDLGTLPAGRSVVIQFDATADVQTNAVVQDVSLQGVVTGTQGAAFTVNTDDPAVGGAADPNVFVLDELTLGSHIFNDLDGDGAYDAGEGVANVALTLFADTNSNGVFDSGTDQQVATTTTDANGAYSFAGATGLGAGNYILRMDESNFAAGAPLDGLFSLPGSPDPDDNVDNDDNAARFAGEGARTAPISLSFNTEPTNAVGNDANNSLDAGFSNPFPTMSDVTAAQTYNENAAPKVLDDNGTMTITDADSTQMQSARVTITDFLAGDALSATSSATVTATWDPVNHWLDLTGSAPLADYQTVLASVAFQSTSENPTNFGANPTRSIAWEVTDPDGNASTPQTTTLTITASNDAPTLAGLDAASFNENTVNAAAQLIDTAVAFADLDSADLNGGNLTVTYTGAALPEDQLSVLGVGGITVTGGTTVNFGGNPIGTIMTNGANGADLVVSLNTASATPAAVDALIQALAYSNSSDTPTATRTVSLTVNDGDGGTSAAATALVTVTAVNDQPSLLALSGNPTYAEGAAPVALDADGNLGSDDPDDANWSSASLEITGGFVGGDELSINGATSGTDGGVAWSFSGTTLTLSGNAGRGQYVALLEQAQFRNTGDDPTSSGASTSRTITWTVTDAGSPAASSTPQTTTVTINADNDPPNAILVQGGGSLSVAEFGLGGSAGGAAVGTVFAQDPDDSAGFVYSFAPGGNAGGRFAIDSGTGAITVVNATLLDSEQNATHNITVRAQDPGGAFRDEVFAVAVTNVDPENVIGDESPNTFFGGPLGDILRGLGGADHLVGGGGSDALIGGPGADTMDGGPGNDFYSVETGGPLGDQVNENPGEGIDVVYASVDYTLGPNLETLVLTGAGTLGIGNGNNNALYSIGLGPNTLAGGLGNDDYFVTHTADQVDENPGAGFDILYAAVNHVLPDNVEILVLTGTTVFGVGNGGDNLLYGNDLDNALTGGAGADQMAGGLGNDDYGVDNIGDQVFENPGGGTDNVYASVSFTLGPNLENLILTGTGTTGTGNAGNNALYNLGGVNTLAGGSGNDDYLVANTADTVVENPGGGVDTVYASADFTLPDNLENLILVGAAVVGTGNSGENAVIGNGQANTLDGRGGGDDLFGNGGNDTFVFRRGEADGDALFDFSGNGAAAGDSLRFEGFGTAAAGASFVQLNATQWQINSSDGLAHEIITLANGAAVHASDVLFA